MTAVELGVVAILSRQEASGTRLVAAVLSAGNGTAHFRERWSINCGTCTARSSNLED